VINGIFDKKTLKGKWKEKSRARFVHLRQQNSIHYPVITCNTACVIGRQTTLSPIFVEQQLRPSSSLTQPAIIFNFFLTLYLLAHVTSN